MKLLKSWFHQIFQEFSFTYMHQFQCYGGLSKGDYEKVAPPHSFVHLDDFDTIEELSDHLNHLQTSPEAYKWVLLNYFSRLMTNNPLLRFWNFSFLIFPAHTFGGLNTTKCYLCTRHNGIHFAIYALQSISSNQVILVQKTKPWSSETFTIQDPVAPQWDDSCRE